MCSSGCCSMCGGCKAFTAIVALVITLTTVAAAIGVYMTHMTAAGWSFGTTEGSLSLITLIVSLKVWLKLVRKLCPCRCKSGMMMGGKCPDCGSMPCKCK